MNNPEPNLVLSPVSPGPRVGAGADGGARAGGAWCFKRHFSLAEEPELLPAYMVYFAGCNLRCRFCIQAPRCFHRGGEPVEPGHLARVLHRAVERGARSIVLVGGEPSLHAGTIIALAREPGPPLPLVLKTNLVMTPAVLEMLRDAVALFLADFKFGPGPCAAELAGARAYWPTVTGNLERLAGRARLWVRHLLMPGHLDCCFRPVARWVAEHLPETPLHLMTGYVPAWRTLRDADLGRTVRPEEIATAQAYLRDLGLEARRRQW